MANTRIEDRNSEFITPDLDIKKLSILQQIRDLKKATPPEKTEFIGSVRYKVTGNKIVADINERTEAARSALFELQHAVADPFRDEDIDAERLRSKGAVNRDSIENRNIIFIQSDDLYQLLYIEDNIEEANNVATFLLRVSLKGDDKQPVDKGSKVNFTFNDPVSLRGPQIKITKEKIQQVDPSKPAEGPSKSRENQKLPLSVRTGRGGFTDNLF